jgi:hypothetical protein
LDVAIEAIENAFPQTSVFLDPSCGLIECIGTELTPTRPTSLVRVRQLGCLEDSDVLHDSRDRDAQRHGQRRDRHGSGREAVEDLAAMRVCQGRERAVKRHPVIPYYMVKCLGYPEERRERSDHH